MTRLCVLVTSWCPMLSVSVGVSLTRVDDIVVSDKTDESDGVEFLLSDSGMVTLL